MSMLDKRKRGGASAVLTKRRTQSNVEEIKFDFDARSDYLTGFHKRKLQRTKHAQEEALKKAREEKIRERKELRDERKRELEEHVKAVNDAVRKAEGAGEGASSDGHDEEDLKAADVIWNENEGKPQLVDHEDEYTDDEAETTVTVEAVEVTREGLQKVEEPEESEEDGAKSVPSEGKNADTTVPSEKQKKRIWTKEKPSGLGKKKKKFRYESKSDRKMTRAKERAGSRAKARSRKDD